MSRISIEFSTDNVAFRNDGDESLNTNAVADILRELADKIGERTPNFGEIKETRIRDTNGNAVGWISIEEDFATEEEA